MNNLYIPASPTTPEIDFRFDEHTLSMRGESYPENASAFYADIIDAVRTYLKTCENINITVNVSLGYFNSSSTTLLFSLFDALNMAAIADNHVTLNWYYDEEDETILEFGEELRDDFRSLDFQSHLMETV